MQSVDICFVCWCITHKPTSMNFSTLICMLFSCLTSWHKSWTVLLFHTEVQIKLNIGLCEINKTSYGINVIIICKNQKMEDNHRELELSARLSIIQKILQVQLYTNKFKNKILVHCYIMNNLMIIQSTHMY